MDSPGFDGPGTWLAAISAVARDLHCLRHGREINVDRITWGLAITDDWSVMVGWQGPRLDVSGYSFGGLTMNTPFEEAVVWIAYTVQTEFAGHQFVQWPSHGQRLLEPHLGEDGPVWVDRGVTEKHLDIRHRPRATDCAASTSRCGSTRIPRNTMVNLCVRPRENTMISGGAGRSERV